MGRLFKILVVFSLITALAGCNEANNEADIKGIKIGELAPTGRQMQIQILQTTNVNVITYEVPAEKQEELDGILQMLDWGMVKYTDANGFFENGLMAAGGEMGEIVKVGQMLQAARAKKLFTTTLMIASSQTEIVTLSKLSRRTKISYIRRAGVVENTEAGPGIIGLQISARKFGTTPVSTVGVVPIIAASTEGLPPQLAEKVRQEDLRIYSAAFRLNMKPGDFVMLAPASFKADEQVAASRFFIRPGPKPSVLVLLIVCSSIT
jgi:hypothetical protein